MLARSAGRVAVSARRPALEASFSVCARLHRYGPRKIIIKAPDSQSAADPTGDGVAWRRPSRQFYGSLFSTKSRGPDDSDPQSSSTDPAEAEPTQPSKPLPDLRYGIPHNFGQHDGADKTTGKAGEAESEPIDDRSSGEFPSSAYETSTDRKRNALAKYSLVTIGLIATATAMWYGRNWESEEQENAHPDAPSGWGLPSFWARLRARFSQKVDYYTEPTFPKLLPELDPAMRPPSGMTLVLSLEDLMVHSKWTREHGWQTAKRPGLDYFLRYLSQYYELVLFTTVPMVSAEPVLARLDPYRIITWPLFREATRYDDGEYVKDLSFLNRDLSKVIVIDTNAKHTKFQPENAIIIDPWKGTPGDKDLIALIPFLEYVAAMEIPDVRKVLDSFSGTSIPEEFARREAAKRAELERQLAANRAAQHKTKNGGFAWLASALGMGAGANPTGEPVPGAGVPEGKMLSDIIREQGIKRYEMLDAQIREQGEQWLKELEAEQKRMQDEQMKSMKMSFLSGWFGLGGSSKGDETEAGQVVEQAVEQAAEQAEKAVEKAVETVAEKVEAKAAPS